MEADPFVRRFLATALWTSGIQPREAATSTEARRILAEEPAFQGLVAEAEEDGLGLLRSFRGGTGLLTCRGEVSAAVRAEAQALGAIVVPKPFGLDAIREFMARIR